MQVFARGSNGSTCSSNQDSGVFVGGSQRINNSHTALSGTSTKANPRNEVSNFVRIGSGSDTDYCTLPVATQSG